MWRLAAPRGALAALRSTPPLAVAPLGASRRLLCVPAMRLASVGHTHAAGRDAPSTSRPSRLGASVSGTPVAPTTSTASVVMPRTSSLPDMPVIPSLRVTEDVHAVAAREDAEYERTLAATTAAAAAAHEAEDETAEERKARLDEEQWQEFIRQWQESKDERPRLAPISIFLRVVVHVLGGLLLVYHFHMPSRAWMDKWAGRARSWIEDNTGGPLWVDPADAHKMPSPFDGRAQAFAIEDAKRREEARRQKAKSPPSSGGSSGPGSASGGGGGMAAGNGAGAPPQPTAQPNALLTRTIANDEQHSDTTRQSGIAALCASATAAIVALLPSMSAAPASAPEVREMENAVEMLKLVQLQYDLTTLQELERIRAAVPRAIDAQVQGIVDALNVGAEKLPAMKALLALRDVFVSPALPMPDLPAPPRWGMPPRDAAEARERLQQIKEFRVAYELAVIEQTEKLQVLLAQKFQPHVDALMASAREEFDVQLPLRLKASGLQTKGALEAGEMVERAQMSLDVVTETAARWTNIMADELEQQRADLERRTTDVLAKQQKALNKEMQPEVQAAFAKIESQQKQIKHLHGELAKSAKIEKTAERVHLLTNLLLNLEEALRLDEHKQPLFVAPSSDSAAPPPPKTGADLQNEWRKLLDAAQGDPQLLKLAQRIPLDSLSSNSAVAVQSLSSLKKSFNSDVEKAVRAATFLPEHVPEAEHSLPASLYARAVSSLAMREGYELRAPSGPADDAARLNNALFYLNRRHDLASALAELESLTPPARAQAAEWMAQARGRVEVERVFEQIRHSVEATAKTYIDKGKF